MKKITITIVCILLLVLTVPSFVYANDTYNGIKISGKKDVDWEFVGDEKHGTIIIKENNVSLSGKASSDIDILVGSDVTNLELNSLSQGEYDIYIGPDDETYSVNEFVLNISGNNTIEHIDIFDFDNNGTPENNKDDIWYQADPFVLEGNSKDKDSLTLMSDLIGGEKGLEIKNIELVQKKITDKSGDEIETGLSSHGPITITDSKLEMSWGIFAAGEINIINSEVVTEEGICSSYNEFDAVSGEGKELYYDINIKNSDIQSNEGLVGNNILLEGLTQIKIVLDAEDISNSTTSNDGIYAHGIVTFALEGNGAKVISTIKDNDVVTSWAINAKKGINFEKDNGIKTGGNIIYVDESAYGVGSYTLENNKNSIYSEIEILYSEGIEAPKKIERIWGQTQYDTSYAIAEKLKKEMGVDKFDSVIITSGRDYPDALSGSYLAKKVNAPILLIDKKSSSNISELKAYIYANLKKNGTVYILGGNYAVPLSVEKWLTQYNVKRLGGYTLYDTNLLILREAGVTDKDILICTGRNYADGLSCSSTGLPILLVNKTLTTNQKKILSQSSGNIYIIGGTSAINKKIETEANKYGKVKRVGGWTKYDTSVLVAQEFFAGANKAVISYGENFPDALCGGPLAMKLDAPMLLASDKHSSEATGVIKKYSINGGLALGGYTVLSANTVKKVFGMGSREVIVSVEYK